jgi:ecdysteroid kinase
MGDSRIPRCMEELTPQWLTGALCEGGVLRDATVTAARCEGIGVGAGFLGQLGRLRLEYDKPEEGAPASLIAKMPTVDPGGREICGIFQFYEREIRFYDDVAGNADVRVPQRYYSAMDKAADDYLILLEDITDAQMVDEVAGCSAGQAETAIRGIAKFHNAWWRSPRLESLDWMPYANSPVQQSAEPSYNQAWEPFLQMFGDKLSPKMRDIAGEMRTHVIDLLNALADPPHTIAHGDFRLDNIFFGENGVAPVAAIDWQISFRGRGIFDVAYFLSSCLEPDVRKANEMRLLKIWYDTAPAGHAGYTWDDAVTDYRRALLFCNVYTVIGIGSLDAANDRGMALFHAWLRRRSTAIEELDAGELMPR